MAYTTNRFCWHGLFTSDTARAAAFYPEVLGWKTQEVAMGDAKATMFAVGGTPLAHYATLPMPGVPTHWTNYLRVDDVDASTKAAVANGGKVVKAPDNIPPGRFSVVSSPSGATLSLFHEADEKTAAHHPGGIGDVHWVELHSQGLDADLKWLTSTFGFETQDMPMPNGTYTMLKHGGEMRGGIMKAMMDKAPSMWLTWFSVDNADAAITRVTGHGGKTLSDTMDMPGIGRMAVVQDPSGAVFGVIQPAAK